MESVKINFECGFCNKFELRSGMCKGFVSKKPGFRKNLRCASYGMKPKIKRTRKRQLIKAKDLMPRVLVFDKELYRGSYQHKKALSDKNSTLYDMCWQHLEHMKSVVKEAPHRAKTKGSGEFVNALHCRYVRPSQVMG